MSLADLIFNASFSGDAVEAYNTMYGAGNVFWELWLAIALNLCMFKGSDS